MSKHFSIDPLASQEYKHYQHAMHALLPFVPETFAIPQT
jgi:hypothetical protein